MKIHLATFYSSDLKRSAQRFKYQAEEMGIYDHIHIFSQNDLNLDFKNYVSELIKKGKKKEVMDIGYGKLIFIKLFCLK
tara:strand:- start:342 stop:578 length:237 start_codon:yes stop_codon:yes gene_type:complete